LNIPNLSILVISSTQLGAQEKRIDNVIQLMHGDGVKHYWGGEQRVGAFIQPLIEGLDSPAWDLWKLDGPGVVWEKGEALGPDWWEQQLGSLGAAYPDRRLDAERFSAKAQALARLPAED